MNIKYNHTEVTGDQKKTEINNNFTIKYKTK